MVDFLYDPMTGRCVAWMLAGDVFTDDDRKIATTDRSGNIYALDGELVGHLAPTGVVPPERTGMPDAFARPLNKAAEGQRLRAFVSGGPGGRVRRPHDPTAPSC